MKTKTLKTEDMILSTCNQSMILAWGYTNTSWWEAGQMANSIWVLQLIPVTSLLILTLILFNYSQSVTTFAPYYSNLTVYKLSLYLCFSQFCMHPTRSFLGETLFHYTLYCFMQNAQRHQWQQFYYWCCQQLQIAIMKSLLHQIIQKCALASQHTVYSTCTVKWWCPLYIVISYFQV